MLSESSWESRKSPSPQGTTHITDTFSVRNASSTLAVSYGRVRVSSIIYLVGLIVVVMAILSFIGLR